MYPIASDKTDAVSVWKNGINQPIDDKYSMTF